MPLCVLYTNVPNSEVPKDFEIQLSQALSEVLSKPIERISVNVIPDQRLVRAGTSEPTCWMNLWSIGVFSAENNPGFASKLFPLITEKLGIGSNRIVLLFHDIKPEQVAVNS